MDCGLKSLFSKKPKRKNTNNYQTSNLSLEGWQRLVLDYLKELDTKSGIETLNVPFNRLGFGSVTEFMKNIPPEMAQEYGLKDGVVMKKKFQKSDRIVWKDKDGDFFFGSFIKYSPNFRAEIKLEEDQNTDKHRKKKMSVLVQNLQFFKEFLKDFIPNLPAKSNVTLVDPSYQERSVDTGNDNNFEYRGSHRIQDRPNMRSDLKDTIMAPHEFVAGTEKSPQQIYANPENWQPGRAFVNHRTGEVAIMTLRYLDSSGLLKVHYQLVSEQQKFPGDYKECLLSDFMTYWYLPDNVTHPGTSNNPSNADNAMEVDDDTNIFDDSNLAVQEMETEITEELKLEEQSRKDDPEYHKNTISPPVSKPQRNSIIRQKIRGSEKRHHKNSAPYPTSSSAMKAISSKPPRMPRNRLEDEKQIVKTIEQLNSGERTPNATPSIRPAVRESPSATITSQNEDMAAPIEYSNTKITKENSNLLRQRRNSQEERVTEHSPGNINTASVNIPGHYDSRYPQENQKRNITDETKLDSSTPPANHIDNVSQQDSHRKNMPKIKSFTTDISPKHTAAKLAAVTKNINHLQQESYPSPLKVFTTPPTKPPRGCNSSYFPAAGSGKKLTMSNQQSKEMSRSFNQTKYENEDEIRGKTQNRCDNLNLNERAERKNRYEHPEGIKESKNRYENPEEIKESKNKFKNVNRADSRNRFENVSEREERKKRQENVDERDTGRDKSENVDERDTGRDKSENVDERDTGRDKSENVNERDTGRDKSENVNERDTRRDKSENVNEVEEKSKRSDSPSSNVRRKEKTVVKKDHDRRRSAERDVPIVNSISNPCGINRGIQWSRNSCFIDASLFSFYYLSDIFDILTLKEDEEDEILTKNVKKILRENIVAPLRKDRYCSSENVDGLRNLLTKFSSKMNGAFMDAEEFMFILFEQALKLKEFIRYSEDTQDFLHQIVLGPNDASSKCQTVQNLFEFSLKTAGDMKLEEMPSPALILVMPRSNGKLIRYDAIVPNLTLNIAPFIEKGPKFCLCNNMGTLECVTCKVENGDEAIVYCKDCVKDFANQVHESCSHPLELKKVELPKTLMELTAVICIRDKHYVAFTRNCSGKSSQWLFFDSLAGIYPKVELVENLEDILGQLAKSPNKYKAAVNYSKHLRRILTDSHICIYQPIK